MKKIAIIFLLLFGAVAARAQSNLVLKKDTPIHLQLKEALSSERAKPGDSVEFLVTEDIKIGNVVVISKGSRARGLVGEAMSGKAMGVPKLNVHLGTVTDRNGFAVPVTGICPAEQPNVDHLGQEIELPAGTPATAMVESDTSLYSGKS